MKITQYRVNTALKVYGATMELEPAANISFQIKIIVTTNNIYYPYKNWNWR